MSPSGPDPSGGAADPDGPPERTPSIDRPRRIDRLRGRLAEPPPGPFRRGFWRSPLRGPWLTSFLGTILAPSIVIMFATGLISQWAYHSSLGHNATTPVNFPSLFVLPASWPSWTYTITQGTHVTLGLVLIPIILAKLWSVVPRLFQWPAVRSPAMAIERLSILLLVSSMIVEFVTGTLDVEYWYPWHFDYYTIHYYGAWVFFAAFAVHFCVKLPTVVRAYRDRGWLTPLREDLRHTRPEPAGDDATGLVATNPSAPTLSRRGLLATVGGASLAVLVANLGETIGGPFRRTALLAARGRVYGTGPNGFPVTTTARSAQITRRMVGASWRLHLSVANGRTLHLSRDELLSLPQHEATLTITCVEGWSTSQHWRGVRLARLRDLLGAHPEATLLVSSLQPAGPFRHITLSSEQVRAADALLALHVNGVELAPDHGYPARVIVPDNPGVHNTKWVGSLEFSA